MYGTVALRSPIPTFEDRRATDLQLHMRLLMIIFMFDIKLLWPLLKFKGALAKILGKKILHFRFEEKLCRFRSECIVNNVSIYICLKANEYVHGVNEWRFNIYREYWKTLLRSIIYQPWRFYITLGRWPLWISDLQSW